MTPTLKQLRYLVALADTGHFGKAADQCAITQSTLSAGILDLEAGLGTVLVERGRRQTSLTPVGTQTVERARRLLADVDDLVRAASTGHKPLTGPLHMGVIPTIAPFFLPCVLPGLRDEHRKLKLFLREDQTLKLIDQLDSGRLDVAVLAFPFDHPAIDHMDIAGDPFLLCRRKGSTTPAPRLSDLNSHDLLLLEDGHCLRDHVLTSCRLAGRGPVTTFQATSLHTLVQMVESGLGATLVPRMAVDGNILDGLNVEALPFTDGSPERRIGLAWRSGAGREEEFRLLGQKLAALWSGRA